MDFGMVLSRPLVDSSCRVSATESTTLDFRAPSAPGTFWLGACIDPVSDESDTGNNCSDGVRVVVDEEPDPAPDLVVPEFSVGNATPAPNDQSSLRVTVRNRGDGPATPTTIRYYRSSDSTISTSDHQFASDAVPALSASATESWTIDYATPSTPGTFYYGACIDPVSDELNTGNNCSSGARVVVGERGPLPDLIVFDVSPSDASPVTSAVIQLQVEVRNVGFAPSTPTTLRFYQSSDSMIGDTGDTELGSEAVAALAVSATESWTIDYATPSTPGAFYLGACVDIVSDESDTGNNCSEGVLVTTR